MNLQSLDQEAGGEVEILTGLDRLFDWAAVAVPCALRSFPLALERGDIVKRINARSPREGLGNALRGHGVKSLFIAGIKPAFTGEGRIIPRAVRWWFRVAAPGAAPVWRRRSWVDFSSKGSSNFPAVAMLFTSLTSEGSGYRSVDTTSEARCSEAKNFGRNGNCSGSSVRTLRSCGSARRMTRPRIRPPAELQRARPHQSPDRSGPQLCGASIPSRDRSGLRVLATDRASHSEFRSRRTC